MATPQDKPVEQPVQKKQKASAAKKRGKKGTKTVKKQSKGHGRAPGDKTAREWAVEYLKAHKGKAPFGELTKWVADKLGGNLSWVPTYYMKSPGFSRPERGIVAFSQKDYDSGRKEIAEARKANLAKARGKAGKKGKGKKGKKETTEERRKRTAAELKAKNEEAKAEFDAAVQAKNGK